MNEQPTYFLSIWYIDIYLVVCIFLSAGTFIADIQMPGTEIPLLRPVLQQKHYLLKGSRRPKLFITRPLKKIKSKKLFPLSFWLPESKLHFFFVTTVTKPELLTI